MGLFEVPQRAGRTQDSTIAKKAKTVAKHTATVKGGTSLADKIALAKAMVEKNLGQYKDKYDVIRQEEMLHDYITECIGNGVISIDTETDGLDPILNHIAGPCIYTPGQKGVYIPMNHISYITQTLVPNQLSKEVVNREFQRFLNKKIDIIMFNSKFDIRVLRNQVGLKDMYCTWDGYLAARLLNENEPSNALKKLHQKYVLNGEADAFTFEELFKGIPFTMIPINTGYLYAARDPEITYELYEYQRKHLRLDHEREDLRNVAWVFYNIEMPCVSVVADMEDNGVAFDLDYAHELSEKYHKMLDDAKNEFYQICSEYEPLINAYKMKNANHKLDTPINIGSPTQLAVLLYDILKVESVDRKSPGGTGEPILSKMDNPIAKAVLNYRTISKLISTYIDKLPECVNPKDGRIHCSFNQYGADTGRMSSSDPNLQNIPSRNHDIRKMFIATQEETIVNFDTDEFLEVDKFTEVFINDEWVPVSRFGVGDTIDIFGELFTISNIEEVNEKVRIYL